MKSQTACHEAQRDARKAEVVETVAAIQEGMASAGRGELKPAAQVLDEMRARYGLSAFGKTDFLTVAAR